MQPLDQPNQLTFELIGPLERPVTFGAGLVPSVRTRSGAFGLGKVMCFQRGKGHVLHVGQRAGAFGATQVRVPMGPPDQLSTELTSASTHLDQLSSS